MSLWVAISETYVMSGIFTCLQRLLNTTSSNSYKYKEERTCGYSYTLVSTLRLPECILRFPWYDRGLMWAVVAANVAANLTNILNE